MYLWKVDLLVDDFKKNRVTQKEQFKYMLLYSILMVLVTDPYIYITETYTFYSFLNTIVATSLTAFGIYYCYTINAKGDNNDFIVRLMCLGLPVSFRLAAIFLPIYIMTDIAGEFSEVNIAYDSTANESFSTTPMDVFLGANFFILYYLYLSLKLRDISNSTIT